jgi:hypothetical protein
MHGDVTDLPGARIIIQKLKKHQNYLLILPSFVFGTCLLTARWKRENRTTSRQLSLRGLRMLVKHSISGFRLRVRHIIDCEV